MLPETIEWIPTRMVLLISWLMLSVCIGSFTLIFFPFGIAISVTCVLASPALLALLLPMWSYERLLLIAVISMSNLFLLHKVIALHLPSGQNLFSIRDVLLIAVIVAGLYYGRDRLLLVARHPLVWPGIVIVALLPTASLLGLINGAKILNVAQEIFIFTMWLLPLVVTANIRNLRLFRILFKTFIVLGILISLGVILEVASFGSLQLVSTLRALAFRQLLVRVFPDAWVFMIVTFMSSIVGILANRKILVECGTLTLVITAIVCTMQRGMLFAPIGAVVILVILVAIGRHRELKARRVAVPMMVFLIVLVSLAFVADQVSPFLGDWLTTRYQSMGKDAGGRLYELTKVGEVFRENPLAGVGLGARYRAMLPETNLDNTGGLDMSDDGTFCHNFEGFCLVKLGLPGALAFLAFSFAILIRLFRYSFGNYEVEVRQYGLILTITFIAWLVLAQSDNVFGDIRTLPICATAAGMLAALDLIEQRNIRGTCFVDGNQHTS